ncbi:NADP-dependent oxidoreductase [Streptomyces xanthii]|uniref:NADP-dependent oxidoreductase n=1 Tax=Streptomyces xanthii TaxID=2768069 RepID=A0A7H1BH04_9ACTN|nr:NADP-dependent oxidoreductase [Streptomyces xanthii]QNS08009.1 NADP-dependent oxidoreductase [Streptomyces xanthii]
MRAAVVSRFGGPEAIEIVETAVPAPGPGQVRIQVAAAALNPVDAATRAGVFGARGDLTGLGWDVAGTVGAVGEGAPFAVGDPVFALFTGHHKELGTHAEQVVLDAGAVARAPKSVDATHAATLPLNTLTAAQSLDRLGLRPGQRLLITGAGGGVGAHAVELAAHRGLEVTALGPDHAEDFLRSRGAAHFLPRGTEPGAGAFDGVLDAAGLGADALKAVRDGGAYMGLWPGQEPAAERGVVVQALSVEADGPLLAELARLTDEGVLLPRVARTYPLDEVAEAHTRLAEGGLPGRLVLVP